VERPINFIRDKIAREQEGSQSKRERERKAGSTEARLSSRTNVLKRKICNNDESLEGRARSQTQTLVAKTTRKEDAAKKIAHMLL